MCIELYSDKHITQSTQNWINWLVSHKLMLETLRFLQSRSPGYCSTQSNDLLTSAISSTICETGIFTICSSSPGFPTHTTHTKFQQLMYRLCVLLNHAVLVMDPFHEVTPRIRTNRIALNGRLNEGLLVRSRG